VKQYETEQAAKKVIPTLRPADGRQSKLFTLLPVMLTSEVSRASLQLKNVVQAACVCDRGRRFVTCQMSAR
jgi:hypothetical protein